MRLFVPSGASGVLFQSNVPDNSACADFSLLRREKRSMLSVSSTCGRNSSHSWMGHVGSSVARLAMKWSLNVAMARSAALAR